MYEEEHYKMLKDFYNHIIEEFDMIKDIVETINEYENHMEIDHIKEKQSWIKQKLGIDASLDNIAQIAINEIKEQIIKQRFDLY
jgi:hypothetical protein